VVLCRPRNYKALSSNPLVSGEKKKKRRRKRKRNKSPEGLRKWEEFTGLEANKPSQNIIAYVPAERVPGEQSQDRQNNFRPICLHPPPSSQLTDGKPYLCDKDVLPQHFHLSNTFSCFILGMKTVGRLMKAKWPHS
jgi:hypothetical protein